VNDGKRNRRRLQVGWLGNGGAPSTPSTAQRIGEIPGRRFLVPSLHNIFRSATATFGLRLSGKTQSGVAPRREAEEYVGCGTIVSVPSGISPGGNVLEQPSGEKPECGNRDAARRGNRGSWASPGVSEALGGTQ
jgi:hypothetical protein